MLNVTDYIEVARRPQRAEKMLRNAAGRFDRSRDRAPVIVWNVCRHCNMTCPHCYAAATDKPSRRRLSTDEGLELIDEMAESGVGVLIFSGGEPLMRDDLFALIERAKERRITPLLSTNGVLIDQGVAQRLAELGVGYVGVSIDGLAAFNDTYRGLENAYERAFAGLRHSRKAGIKTGLRITLTKKNLDQLAPLIDEARKVPVDRFYVSHLLYSGRGVTMEGADLTPQQTRQTLLWLFEQADKMLDEPDAPGFVTGGNDSDGPLLLEWLEERYGHDAAAPVRRLLELRGGNSAGEGILNIDHLGRVHPDQFWRQETLGRVREDSFQEILNHPLRDELRDRLSKLHGRCAACKFASICRGSHRERALAHYGDRWAADPACVMSDAEIGIAPQTHTGQDVPPTQGRVEEGIA